MRSFSAWAWWLDQKNEKGANLAMTFVSKVLRRFD
jgi:hypothetical protein